jgi:hypothetical protein
MNSETRHVFDWLLKGDPAIRWQCLRDLKKTGKRTWEKERRRVIDEGWGARLLALQDPDGTWGGGLYSPKWVSTTYTMLLLRRFGAPPSHPGLSKAAHILLDKGFREDDGGIALAPTWPRSETCVTAMVLSILCAFRVKDSRVDTIVRHLLGEQMPDGGWNCERYRGDTHSSFHTTISVLEGFRAYDEYGGRWVSKTRKAEAAARKFFLVHRLFRSHRTGEIVKPEMTRFSFPPRWHYDVLRGLDYFQAANAKRDKRLTEAIELLKKKRTKDGRWPLQNRYSGRTFFEMERVGKPSRWNTLRALRVLQWWDE